MCLFIQKLSQYIEKKPQLIETVKNLFTRLCRITYNCDHFKLAKLKCTGKLNGNRFS